MSDVKIVVNKTFSGFLSSLKQEILNGYASCAKSELRNGFFSAVLAKATDSKYVSAVSKMDEAETNAFKITFFVEGLGVGLYPKVVDFTDEERSTLKALEELAEISQTTGQYDASQANTDKESGETVKIEPAPIETLIEKKPAQKRQRKGKVQ